MVMPHSARSAVQNPWERPLWSLLGVLSGYSEGAKMFDGFLTYVSPKAQISLLETVVFLARVVLAVPTGL